MPEPQKLLYLSVDASGFVYDAEYEPPTKRRDLFDIVTDQKFLCTEETMSLSDQYPLVRWELYSLYRDGVGNPGKTAEELNAIWLEANGEDYTEGIDDDFVRKWLDGLKADEWQLVDKSIQAWLDEDADIHEWEQYSIYPTDGYAFAYQYLEDRSVSKLGIALIDGFAPGNDARAARIVRPITEVNRACEAAGEDFRFVLEDDN